MGQVNLAECYEKGHGVPKNKAEAIRLYRMAAQIDYPQALDALKRLGVSKSASEDESIGFDWSPKTAKEAGQTAAQFSNQSGFPIYGWVFTEDNFEETVIKNTVNYIDPQSVEDYNIEGKIYKKGSVYEQYLRDQKFAKLYNDPDEFYRSEHIDYIVDCPSKMYAVFSKRIFEGNEWTGKINSYDSDDPKRFRWTQSKPNTISASIVDAICEQKYMYSPQVSP